MTTAEIFEDVRAALALAANASEALAALKNAILPIFTEDQQTALKESYATARSDSDTVHQTLQAEAADE